LYFIHALLFREEVEMTKAAVIIGLALLLLSPVAKAHSAEISAGTNSTSHGVDMQDKKQETACDCCQKCKAAKSNLKTKEDEEALEKDGCGDCCTRCGEPLTPRVDDTPPEVIEKNVPPDIKEKAK
jgi:hypothetical protein